MSEYNDAEADELPLCEEPTTPMDAAEEARKDVHRKHLERQRSRKISRQLSRQLSRQKSVEEEKAVIKEAEASKLIQEEKAETGRVCSAWLHV